MYWDFLALVLLVISVSVFMTFFLVAGAALLLVAGFINSFIVGFTLQLQTEASDTICTEVFESHEIVNDFCICTGNVQILRTQLID